MSDARPDPVEGTVAEPAPDALSDSEVIEGELVDDDPGAVDAGASSEVTFETLVTDLERVAGERDQFLDAYRRTMADLENFKKQSQRRAEDELQRRLGGFVERFLPVLDACDAARLHGAGDEVEPIASALLGILEKEGLERIDPIGEVFDPAVADAVVHEPGAGGDHVIAEVLRAGYSWRGRVLRPAMVKVTD
ncbi:MAG: nucleotide exchange factor GrpE [Acidimicrobiales bacterium]